MISALLFINQKGEVVISRMYRDGFTRATAETFRAQVIGNKEEGRSPVKVVGETVFMYIKHGNMFVVAVTSGNAQAAMTFQFLHAVVKVLTAYFGAFDEDSIRNNFVLIYELLDEVLDYGYPQNCTTDVLKMYITQEGNKSAALAQKEMASSVTIQARYGPTHPRPQPERSREVGRRAPAPAAPPSLTSWRDRTLTRAPFGRRRRARSRGGRRGSSTGRTSSSSTSSSTATS
jgi:AP-2 complex subunit mu-1